MSLLSKILSGVTGGVEQIPENAILLDVRNPEECATGVIANSVQIPLGQLEQLVAQKLPNKDAPILVYCAAGMRAMSARSVLLKMGYKEVYNGMGVTQVAQRLGQSLVAP